MPDIEAIKDLLQANNLPFSDLAESPIDFFVAWNDNKLIGCIGIEKYGTEGLMRSFTVEKEFQNKGLGKALYSTLIEFSKQNGIINIHLLTNTAKDYFARIGFKVENRNKAPEKIKQSKEFSTLCPASSTYMILADIKSYASGENLE